MMDTDELPLTPAPLQHDALNAVRVHFASLSMAEKSRVMWGWYWRSVIVTVVSVLFLMFLVGMAGAAGAVIFAMLKIERAIFLQYIHFLRLSSIFAGFVFGFISLFFLIRWLTKSRISKYELWLVRPGKEE